MKKKCVLIVFASLVCLFYSGCKLKEGHGKKDLNPPIAEKIPKEFSLYGHIRVDNFEWLKEKNNSKVEEYLKKENAYTEAVMEHTKKLQERIYAEIIGRFSPTDMSVPWRHRAYYYYNRYEKGHEHPIFYRKKVDENGKEEVVIDANDLAKESRYFHIAEIAPSHDNSRIAYAVDKLGRRLNTIYFKDMNTGKTLKDQIPNVSENIAWANDNKTLFYCIKDDTLRPCGVMKHVLGKDASEDTVVFRETDPAFEVFVSKSKSGKYLFILCLNMLFTEYHFLDANTPEQPFRVFHPREKHVEYHIRHFGDMFYIRTNSEAQNYRLMKTPVQNTSRERWEEVIPHRDDTLLNGFEIFNNYLVLSLRKDGLPHLRIVQWENQSSYDVDFSEPAYFMRLSMNSTFATDCLRYEYSSFITPYSIIEYDMKSRKKRILKQQEVRGAYDPHQFKVERLSTIARDGRHVPISLVYKKGIKKDGENPLLLYGYGSIGSCRDPIFDIARLSLLERGFIYGIAHIRGGQELGRFWYDEGRLLSKMNTFTDFIDCAEYLVEENYTNSDKLFAIGRSSGGTTMSAVVNMRPNLFKGVIITVPFVDIITTMLDPSIPLTTVEYDEWGDPNNKKHYEYMLSYSPYDNIEPKDYPAMLVRAGFHDSQCQYWESAKWVAKLRSMKTDNNPLLLYTNMDAGHFGSSGRFEKPWETAMEYAFIFNLIGIEK